MIAFHTDTIRLAVLVIALVAFAIYQTNRAQKAEQRSKLDAEAFIVAEVSKLVLAINRLTDTLVRTVEQKEERNEIWNPMP